MAVGVDDVEQADNCVIVHFLEQGNLADGCAGNTLIFGFEADLLESDDTVVGGCEIAGFVDDAVCACAMSLA